MASAREGPSASRGHCRVRSSELELWVLQALDRVAAGNRNEDNRVEFKGAWPTDQLRTARRLAGHANSAFGENILWIIGVDEGAGVVGAPPQEVATWWAQVRSEFDGVAPEMIQNLAVPYRGLSVHALLFDTSRPPYTLRLNPSQTPRFITRETPWREGNAVRSCTREDLLRLLVPVARNPHIEVIEGSFTVTRESWRVLLGLYVTPASSERVVIPFRLCRIRGLLEGREFDPAKTELSAPGYEDYLIRVTHAEAIVDGPGEMFIHGEMNDIVGSSNLDFTKDLRDTKSRIRVEAVLRPSRAATDVSLVADLHRWNRSDGPGTLNWHLAPDPVDVILAREPPST